MQINAWDEKYLDEPAYDQRTEGYSSARSLLQTMGGDSEQMLPVVHSAFFDILNVRACTMYIQCIYGRD